MTDGDTFNEDDAKDSLLGFFVEDQNPLAEFRQAVRKLICRDSTTPEQMYHLAKVLFAIDRFPRPTSGIAIEFSLGIRHENGERSYQDVYIDDTSFRAGNGAYIIIEPSVGGDNTSETCIEVEVGGYRDLLHPTAFADWVDAFAMRADDPDQKLDISDSEDGSEINWDADRNESDWENLGSDYE